MYNVREPRRDFTPPAVNGPFVPSRSSTNMRLPTPSFPSSSIATEATCVKSRIMFLRSKGRMAATMSVLIAKATASSAPTHGPGKGRARFHLVTYMQDAVKMEGVDIFEWDMVNLDSRYQSDRYGDTYGRIYNQLRPFYRP
jgi:hypothetical protein